MGIVIFNRRDNKKGLRSCLGRKRVLGEKGLIVRIYKLNV